MKNITYRHARTGATVTHTAPVPGLERSGAWVREDGPAYRSLRKAELVTLCEQRDLDADGKHAELVERLEAHDAEQPVHPSA